MRAACRGGLVLYIAGRATFVRLTLGTVPAGQPMAAVVALALLPVARVLPALAALGLLTAFLLALSLSEWRRQNEPARAGTGEPTPGQRARGWAVAYTSRSLSTVTRV